MTSLPGSRPLRQRSPDSSVREVAEEKRESKHPWLMALLPVALFAAALWVLHSELQHLHLKDVAHWVHSTPFATLGAACSAAAGSYLLLGFQEWLALRYIGRTLAPSRPFLVSFMACAVGHNLSPATLTGGAVRYRLYARDKLDFREVAAVTAFSSVTTGLGLTMLAGATLLIDPAHFAAVLHVDVAVCRIAGVLLVSAIGGYLFWTLSGKRLPRLGGRSFVPPTTVLGSGQIATGMLEITVASSVLWMLLPDGAGISIAAFAGLYAVAVIAGLVSNVPGGIGVFETVIVLGLPQVPKDALVGALLLYRAIYYLLPLTLAAGLLVSGELATQRFRFAKLGRVSETYVAPLVPRLAAVLAFLAGATLLLSGALPTLDAQLRAFREALPLPLLELSHLAASVIGLGLLILARALAARLKAAWHGAVVLLAAGIIASLVRKPELGEAVLLSFVLAVVWLGRHAFYRPSPVFEERFTPAWTASLAIVVIATVWIGFFSYRHVDYANSLWWTFAAHAGAPRMLRASLLVVVLAAAYLAANLLRPARPRPAAASAEDIERARCVLAREPLVLGQLALAGDKRLLFASTGDAFLMYQVIGRSWIALGDPVGNPARDTELCWRFRELADSYGGRTAFYQVRAERLPLYIDMGLVPLKLGEEARVPLDGFSLEGSARAELRQAHRRSSRCGLSFEVAGPGSSLAHLAELRAISNDWLASRNTAEKHFSIGAFSDEYLSRFRLALVRHNGVIVAFGNVWESGTGEELSIDLMRFAQHAPHGTMDFMFVELLLWGSAHGFRWFNLGMAPLAGLGRHRLAPLWHRLGSFVFRHGEHFYNFEGLRRYKSKFGPVWEPRYLVAGGFAAPRVLFDVSVLIAGGVKRLVLK